MEGMPAKTAMKMEFIDMEMAPEPSIHFEKFDPDWSKLVIVSADVYLDAEEGAALTVTVTDRDEREAAVTARLKPGWNAVAVDVGAALEKAGAARHRVTRLAFSRASEEEVTVYVCNLYLSERAPVPAHYVGNVTPDIELIGNGGFEEAGDDEYAPFA